MESLNKKKTVKHLRRGLSIYKTGRSPFWHARTYDSLTKRYVVRSTKESNRLAAADVAEEILADLKAKRDTKHAVAKDSAVTYADVELPPGRLCDRLRIEQDKRFAAAVAA